MEKEKLGYYCKDSFSIRIAKKINDFEALKDAYDEFVKFAKDRKDFYEARGEKTGTKYDVCSLDEFKNQITFTEPMDNLILEFLMYYIYGGDEIIVTTDNNYYRCFYIVAEVNRILKDETIVNKKENAIKYSLLVDRVTDDWLNKGVERHSQEKSLGSTFKEVGKVLVEGSVDFAKKAVESIGNTITKLTKIR